MRRRWSTVVPLIVGVMVVLLASAECTGARPATPTKLHVAAPLQMPANGLCAFIDLHAAAALLVGEGQKDAAMMSTPAPTTAGQRVRCQFAAQGVEPSDSVDVALSDNLTQGVSKFSKLQVSDSYQKKNLNGVPMVWNPAATTLYVRFTDKNRALTKRSQHVDSILTIEYRPGFGRGLYADTDAEPYLATFGRHVVDSINNGTILNPVNPQPEPILTDDKGRQIQNPILVMQVYAGLANDDTLGLQSVGGTISDFWQATQTPYLSQASIRAKIAKSMTAHPNCDDGCTYPGFVVTGWNSAIARSDGAKLGINPQNVADPRMGHQMSVYTSNFPTCMCAWNGTFPPGS